MFGGTVVITDGHVTAVTMSSVVEKVCWYIIKVFGGIQSSAVLIENYNWYIIKVFGGRKSIDVYI